MIQTIKPNDKTDDKTKDKKISIFDLSIHDFTFGIECENYVQNWRVDHDDTHETISKVFDNFNGVLIYYRNIVKRHIKDDEFILHSSPSKYCSTVSAHIHFKAKESILSNLEWKENRYEIYKRLHELVKLFQFFFKNSPKKSSKVIGARHMGGQWCELVAIPHQRFRTTGREYTAITPNGGYNTLEFRYPDVPKSLNQLVFFYYLLRIALNKDIKIPKIPDNYNINKISDLDKTIDGNNNFSYKNPESIRSLKSTYMKIMMEFLDEVMKKNKDLFYDFYKERYVDFKTLIIESLKYELDLFNRFFSNRDTEEDWSNKLKSQFCKNIKVELIKEAK